MQDVDELNAHRRVKSNDDEEDDGEEEDVTTLWEPSGSWLRDFLYFSGPGMLYVFWVSVLICLECLGNISIIANQCCTAKQAGL